MTTNEEFLMQRSIKRTSTGRAGPRMRLLSVLVVAVIAGGCTTIVDGSAHPGRGMTPRPLSGSAVGSALLDRAELQRAYGQAFEPDTDFPDSTGGAELFMPNVQTPPRCAGVAGVLVNDSYKGTAVREIVSRHWKNTERYPKALLIHEAIVTLPTARDAAAQFATMATQWKQCGGASMTIGGNPNFTSRIGAVEEINSVLSAAVDDVSSYMVLPEERALGVRVNCLIELKVIYMGDEDRDGTGHRTPAIADIAHLIMDKVSALA